MKIRFDFGEIERRAAEKGITKLSQLCLEAGVPYMALRKNKSRGSGASITNAWLLSDYLGCSINDIIAVDW
jgi:hypothetical protein